MRLRRRGRTPGQEATVRITSRIEIQRSIQEVFEFVAAPEHLLLWAAGVAGAARTDPGPLGLGATFALRHAGQAGV